jgi:hypothetical protein
MINTKFISADVLSNNLLDSLNFLLDILRESVN